MRPGNRWLQAERHRTFGCIRSGIAIRGQLDCFPGAPEAGRIGRGGGQDGAIGAMGRKTATGFGCDITSPRKRYWETDPTIRRAGTGGRGRLNRPVEAGVDPLCREQIPGSRHFVFA